MKRTKEDMFQKRVEYTLNLLLNNGGRSIDVAKLHYRGATAKKLFETVKTSLDLMGIEYKNQKDTMYMQVPTIKQLDEKKTVGDFFNYFAGMGVTSPMSYAQLYGGDDSFFDALKYMQAGHDYTRKKIKIGLDYGTKDKSAAAVLVGKTIHSIVFDELVDDKTKK